MRLEDRLASKFVCTKCGSTGAEVRRFAATGTGITRFLDIQHNQFVAVSCKNCGYTEIYNPEILEGKDNLGDIIDMIFGL
jgi:hypothetical protein